jgi:hypothetical protein
MEVRGNAAVARVEVEELYEWCSRVHRRFSHRTTARRKRSTSALRWDLERLVTRHRTRRCMPKGAR